MIEPTDYKGFRLYQLYGPQIDVWGAFYADGRSIAQSSLERCKEAINAFLSTPQHEEQHGKIRLLKLEGNSMHGATNCTLVPGEIYEAEHIVPETGSAVVADPEFETAGEGHGWFIHKDDFELV